MIKPPTPAAPPSTEITFGPETSHFDIAGVGNWAEAHIWMFLVFALVGFVFFIFRKGAFAEKFLEYRMRGRELDARQLDDTRSIVEMLRRRYDRPDPLLPFGGDDGDRLK